ncbi:DUF6262 family protein [Rothia sp. CCM 9416]|uniref:DUF6262 family protein n=1 Tax=Rothia sp. CCM 9416 TaxID=3402655 RepID=UPI003AD82C36
MANSAPNTSGLAQAAKDRAAEKEKQAKAAIRRLTREKKPINFASVAQEAGVSRNYLYKHPELRAQIEKLKTSTRSDRSLQATPDTGQENIVAALRLKIRNIETQHQNEIKAIRNELKTANQRIEKLTGQIVMLQYK